MSELDTAIAYLRSPLAIRARCENLFEAARDGALDHFTIDLGALPRVVDEVVAATRAAYPDLRVPAHGRTNQLGADAARVRALDPRAWIDFVFVSVLADAGASAFADGMFSSDRTQPARVDAAALRAHEAPRARALGDALASSPIFIGARPSGIVDHLRARLDGNALSSAVLLRALLDALAPMWPRRDIGALSDARLGDVWRHPAAGGSGPTAGLVPFHGLTQWLAYSLFEPFARAGIAIAHPGALTGLPGHRNGGLLVDLGALVPKHERVRAIVHAPGDVEIVEWRALTVALLDRVAEGVRERLGKSATELPLASVLEGGTWSAGRAVARRLRADGAPPIRVASDGVY